jgi:hypothetical protein
MGNSAVIAPSDGFRRFSLAKTFSPSKHIVKSSEIQKANDNKVIPIYTEINNKDVEKEAQCIEKMSVIPSVDKDIVENTGNSALLKSFQALDRDSTKILSTHTPFNDVEQIKEVAKTKVSQITEDLVDKFDESGDIDNRMGDNFFNKVQIHKKKSNDQLTSFAQFETKLEDFNDDDMML